MVNSGWIDTVSRQECNIIGNERIWYRRKCTFELHQTYKCLASHSRRKTVGDSEIRKSVNVLSIHFTSIADYESE